LKYKVVVFGTKQSTSYLINKFKDDIDLVVTVNDNKSYNIAGKGDVIGTANDNNIECYSTDDYTLKSCKEFFENNEFDIGISYGWQRLIPNSILAKFKHGIFGTHASPLGLPYGKGRSPLNWSIIRDFRQVYFNLFKYEVKADSGMIYSKTKFEINDWDTIESIKVKDLIVTKSQVGKLIEDYNNNNIKLFSQKDNIEETFFPKRSPKDGKIDLTSSVRDIHNLIRGVTKPFPGAFLMCDDTKVTIWNAVPFDNQLDFSQYKVGEVIEFVEGTWKFILKLVDGTLLVNDYECEERPYYKFNLKKGVVLK
jgi:methionyl-tRNA formyltransferase